MCFFNSFFTTNQAVYRENSVILIEIEIPERFDSDSKEETNKASRQIWKNLFGFEKKKKTTYFCRESINTLGIKDIRIVCVVLIAVVVIGGS